MKDRRHTCKSADCDVCERRRTSGKNVCCCGLPVSVEVQFVHRLSDMRSHLLLVFRHWSQARAGVNDQDKDRAEVNDSDRPRVLLLFLEPVSSSEMSEFNWDILHLVRRAEEESVSWSWGVNGDRNLVGWA